MTIPLSPFCYLARNARRVMPVLIVIVTAVLGVSLTAVLTGSMIESGRLVWVKPYERYALVAATEGALTAATVARLRDDPNVGRILPAGSATIQFYGIFGSEPRPVLTLAAEDIRWFMRRTGLRLVAGRLPRPGARELVLHRDIVLGKRLRLGSLVGQEVNSDEFLPGRYTLVGIVAGPYQLGLTVSGRSSQDAPARTLLVFPKPSRASQLERELMRLPRRAMAITTLSTQQRRFERETANLDSIIWALNLVTIGALSLAVGLLNLVFLTQRRGEFGILSALGYSLAFLVLRIGLELLVVALVGWLVGLVLADGVLAALRRLVYDPKGIHLSPLGVRALAFTLPIPLMILAFSLATVLWQLRRLDPVTIVEHRD